MSPRRLSERIRQEAAAERAAQGCTCPAPWPGGVNAHGADCPARRRP